MRQTFIAVGICVSALISTEALATQLIVQPGITLDMPNGWTASRDTTTTWLLERRNGNNVDATMSISIEQRRDHAEAVRQVAAIEAAYDANATYSTIGGWPAMERKVLAQVKSPDELEDGPDALRVVVPDDGIVMAWHAMTAVAAGNQLVYLHSVVHPAGDPALADEALALGRTMKLPPADPAATAADLQQLQSGALRPQPLKATAFAAASAKRPLTGAGGAALNVSGGGEIEVAISGNGRKRIVTNAACGSSFSRDGGVTFATSGFDAAPKDINLDGDCTVTWGPNGRFYRAQLGKRVVPLWVSTNGGSSFLYTANAVDQRVGGKSVDQPHVVADRVNKTTDGKDQLYVVWQGGAQLQSRLACSKDSGATFTSTPVFAASGNIAFPRVSVSRNGNVFVVSRDGQDVVIDKFSSCSAATPLTRQSGFPVRTRIQNVTCPVPGLDRCNDGNILSSPTIAPDDLDDMRVYLVVATTTATDRQDIGVATSADGGLNWSLAVAANSDGKAVRFMPWAMVSRRVLYIGWYDRRHATDPATIDHTSYFRNSVSFSIVSGSLVVGTEVDLSGTDDPQCASGWACGVRAKGDANKCPQPQLAGFCGRKNSNQRCNFQNPSCPNNQKCVLGDGCPKYGDYNGLAAGDGLLVNIWASGTPPTGVTKPATTRDGTNAYVVVTSISP